ncbi:MAG: glycoside hydrolase family 5 protein [Clostridia bacterium]|nr:glycoside hydrolase family 5 protein [Clostridia bacterium]
MRNIIRRGTAILLAALLLAGCLSAAAEGSGVNEPDMAAYAACVNGLAAEYGIPVILWDCSVHVNRAKLTVNYPQYIDAIMACYPERTDPGNAGDDAVFEEETAFEAAANFGPGFNLGNTLDSTSFNIESDRKGEKGWIVLWGKKDGRGNPLPVGWETAWGQPVTTQAIADYVIGLGFNTVRVPVTWAEHLDADNRVDEAWMARVREVVDYFWQRGVYVIVNLHHDGGADGWIEATEASYEAYAGRFASVWTQIAETFADYDERLLFESMNEVLDGANNWNAPSPDAAKWINAWNQLFVTTVRACGGNNALRNLIVMTYSGGGADGNFTRFVLPEDSAENHLMITVHNYDPQAFTWTTATWTKMTARWDDAIHGAELRRGFETYRRWSEHFGVPIVVGEYNADPKNYADYD